MAAGYNVNGLTLSLITLQTIPAQVVFKCVYGPYCLWKKIILKKEGKKCWKLYGVLDHKKFALLIPILVMVVKLKSVASLKNASALWNFHCSPLIPLSLYFINLLTKHLSMYPKIQIVKNLLLVLLHCTFTMYRPRMYSISQWWSQHKRPGLHLLVNS